MLKVGRKMATRRRHRNGEGSITLHRTSGRYMARYSDRNGVRRTVYGKDPEEAQKRVAKKQAEKGAMGHGK